MPIFIILSLSVIQTVEAQERGPHSIGDIKRVLKEFRLLTKPNLKALTAANDSIRVACPSDSVSRIQTSLAAMQEIVDEETKLTANGSFSFTDNLASGQSTADSTKGRSGTQEVKAGISVGRGVYPLEVNLDASVKLTKKKDGTVQEDLSSLFLSVDRNLSGTTLEMFGFLSRTNDDYLGIDQRYETGAGLVVNGLFGKTSKGSSKELRLLHGLTRKKDKKEGPAIYETTNWVACFDTIRAVTESKTSFDTTTTIGNLKRGVVVAKNSLKEKYSLLRVALLAGIFGEVEQASLDSLNTVNDRGWRVEIRPTVKVQILDGLTFRTDYYLKYRISGFRHPPRLKESEIVQSSGWVPKIFSNDVRANLESSAKLKLKGVDLVLTHSWFWDSVPPFVVTPTGKVILAAWDRHQTELSVTIPI